MNEKQSEVIETTETELNMSGVKGFLWFLLMGINVFSLLFIIIGILATLNSANGTVFIIFFVAIFIQLIVLLVFVSRKYKPYADKHKLKRLKRKQIAEEKRELARLKNAERKIVSRPYNPSMSGLEYERYVANVLATHGFDVAITPGSGDYGVDVLAAKNGRTIAIQCKHYAPDHGVGVKAVQEVDSGKRFYECDYAMVITSSHFTDNAYALAQKNSVILIPNNDFERIDNIKPFSETIDRIEELDAMLDD